MLDVPEVVEDAVLLVHGVVPPHGVAVVQRAVDGAAGERGDEADHRDDGERGDDLPPHCLK